MTVSLPSRQRAPYCDITSPFALDDEAFRALPVPDPISPRGAERPAQDRRAEELECAI
jgi:hypothetical protein